MWVPHDLPDVAVGIAEITGIATPRCILCSFDDFCPSGGGGFQESVHLLFAGNVVPDGKRCWADRRFAKPGVMGDVILCPDRKLQFSGQLKESDGTVFKLFSDDPFAW